MEILQVLQGDFGWKIPSAGDVGLVNEEDHRLSGMFFLHFLSTHSIAGVVGGEIQPMYLL